MFVSVFNYGEMTIRIDKTKQYGPMLQRNKNGVIFDKTTNK